MAIFNSYVKLQEGKLGVEKSPFNLTA
jgi:hypothetical protein